MDEPARRRRYYPLLDAIRGLAALMIVTRHAPEYFGVTFPKSYLAVDLFFVLSGLVVANTYEPALLSTMSVRTFSWIRVVRLYPLYFVSVVVAGFAWSLDPHFGGWDVDFALTAGLAFILLPKLYPVAGDDAGSVYPLNPPTWSLFFELVVNVAYARFARRLAPRAIMVIMALAAVGLVGTCALAPRHNLDVGWTPLDFALGAARVSYSFMAGLLIYRWSMSALGSSHLRVPFLRVSTWGACILRASDSHGSALRPSGPRDSGPQAAKLRGSLRVATVAVTSAVILAVVFAVLASTPPGSLSALWDLGAVIILFPLVVVLAMQFDYDERTRRLFAFMGMASYSVYVLHGPSHLLLITLARRGGFALPPAPWSGMIFVALLLVLSILLDRAYDRPLRWALGPGPSASRRKSGLERDCSSGAAREPRGRDH